MVVAMVASSSHVANATAAPTIIPLGNTMGRKVVHIHFKLLPNVLPRKLTFLVFYKTFKFGRFVRLNASTKLSRDNWRFAWFS